MHKNFEGGILRFTQQPNSQNCHPASCILLRLSPMLPPPLLYLANHNVFEWDTFMCRFHGCYHGGYAPAKLQAGYSEMEKLIVIGVVCKHRSIIMVYKNNPK